MTILHISPDLPTAFYLNLFNSLLKLEVTTISLGSYRRKEYVQFAENELITKLFYERYRVVSFFKYLYFVARMIMTRNVDIIHVHGTNIELYAVKFIRAFWDVQVVVTVRQSDLNKISRSKLYRSLFRFSSNGSRFVCKHQGSMLELSRYVRKELIEVIPNGIDSKFLSKQKTEFNLENNDTKEYRFCVVADLMYNKRLDLVVEICDNMISKGTKIILQICGKYEGDSFDRDNHLIQNRDYIQHSGYLNREEMLRFYDQGHVLFLLSDSETFGISIIEGLSQGCFIVMRSRNGVHNFLPSSNYLLFEEHHDVKSFGDILSKRLEDSFPRIGSLDIFGWHSVAEMHKKLYGTL